MPEKRSSAESWIGRIHKTVLGSKTGPVPPGGLRGAFALLAVSRIGLREDPIRVCPSALCRFRHADIFDELLDVLGRRLSEARYERGGREVEEHA